MLLVSAYLDNFSLMVVIFMLKSFEFLINYLEYNFKIFKYLENDLKNARL